MHKLHRKEILRLGLGRVVEIPTQRDYDTGIASNALEYSTHLSIIVIIHEPRGYRPSQQCISFFQQISSAYQVKDMQRTQLVSQVNCLF